MMAALVAAAAVTAAALGAGVASGATPTQPSVSANWAGYVASGTSSLTAQPTTFSAVSGTWVQPKANCSSVETTGSTSSAFWVGLGGNAQTSDALEQAGTEADCSATGKASYFAWYELVPAPSVDLKLAVSPGNRMSATISVAGTAVTVALHNLSTGQSITKTLQMSDPDTTSAEWIAEAPSLCASTVQCREQSLTNFGTVTFSSATATSNGHTGPISDPAWTSTPVELESATGGRFGFGPGEFGGERSISMAVPGSLSSSGSSFSVTWKSVSSSEPEGGYGGYGFGGGGYGGGFGGGGGFAYSPEL